MPGEPVVLIEPRLEDYVGHNFHQTTYLVRALVGLGFRPTVFVNRACQAGLVDDLGESGAQAIPHFSGRSFAGLRARELKWAALAVDFIGSLRSVAGRITPGTPVLFTSGEIELLTGLLMARRLGWWRHRTGVRFFQWDRQGDSPGVRLFPGGMRGVTERLARSVPARELILWGDSQILADEIGGVLGRPVAESPQPITWGEEALGPRGQGRPVVSLQGHLLDEKGFAQFSESLELLRGAPGLEVQGYRGPDADEGQRELLFERVRRRGGRVLDIQPGDYWSTVRSADIVVCPYDPAVYANRTSTVAMDAAGAGAVVIAPRESGLAKMLHQKGVGVAYHPYTPAALAAAIDDVTERWPEHRARAAAQAEKIRARHAPEAVARGLLAPWA